MDNLLNKAIINHFRHSELAASMSSKILWWDNGETTFRLSAASEPSPPPREVQDPLVHTTLGKANKQLATSVSLLVFPGACMSTLAPLRLYDRPECTLFYGIQMCFRSGKNNQQD